MIKLVLSDMDETLKRANEPLVPKRTLKAITALKEAGIDFGPATGRSAYDALPFYGFDARYLQTAICGSGKVVYGKGALVAKRALPAKTLERTLQVIARPKDTYLAYFDEGPAEPPLDVSIRPAWMIFGVTQAQVDYINAHGTSTHLNDEGETKAIKSIWGAAARPQHGASRQGLYFGRYIGASGSAGP